MQVSAYNSYSSISISDISQNTPTVTAVIMKVSVNL